MWTIDGDQSEKIYSGIHDSIIEKDDHVEFDTWVHGGSMTGVMETLNRAIDTFVDDICQEAMKLKDLTLTKVLSALQAKKRGLKLTKEEIEEKKLEIEKKLCDLKVLSEHCKKKSEELQVAEGYRFISPEATMEGSMHPVATAFNTSLCLLAEKLKGDIETATESLRQAREQVQTLAQLSESMMEKGIKLQILHMDNDSLLFCMNWFLRYEHFVFLTF
uniref:Tektin n=1 Tax=Angiostrongylus cantonensis TaxID=6313 RepID=A0A0K0DEK7_ANGCA